MNFLVEQKEWIGVLGGATRYSEAEIIAGYRIGEAIAKRGKNVVTGATTGIPYAAAIGAKDAGAKVVGISPASSFEDHVVRYKKPLDYADMIVYTGMTLEGRSPIIIRSVCGAIFVGGEAGTLNEFTAAWMCGSNVLGVLNGVSGITRCFKEILSECETSWGSKVIFDDDPLELVRRVTEETDQRYLTRARELQCDDLGRDVRAIISRFVEGGGGDERSSRRL